MARENPFLDRVVWITGASSGIGEALARAFSAVGAELVLSARNEAGLHAVAARCASPGSVDVVPLDLTDLDGLPARVAGVLERHGRVDFMVHNAGVAHRDLAMATTLDVDRRIMDTNYFGPVVLTKALLPDMIERGGGTFVVVGSMSGKFGAPLMSAYAASKHALQGFFESLRAEVEPRGVRVCVVIPGFIRTSITANALTGDGEAFGRVLSVHERGMSADACAARIVRAVRRGRREVLIGGSEVLTVWLHRFLPGVASRVVRSHPIRTRDRWLKRLGLLREPPE